VNDRRTERTAYAGIVASIAATALVLGASSHWLTLSGALILACVPSGAAVMCWIDSGEDAAQAGLTLVVSLAVFATASAIMIWLAAWQPRALFALAALSAVSCLFRLTLRRTA
jgi:hypothetical protein